MCHCKKESTKEVKKSLLVQAPNRGGCVCRSQNKTGQVKSCSTERN